MRKSLVIISILLLQVNAKAQTITPGNSTITPGGGAITTTEEPKDKTAVQLPEPILNNFEKNNPSRSEVTWKVEGNKYWVSFVDPKTRMGKIILYDKNGNVLQTENEADDVHYPKNIQTYLNKRFPQEGFRVWETRQNSKTRYYIKRNEETIYFDANGKVIDKK